ncbi:MAG: putative LPS assembly protein LptD [Candidatus Cyclobacteriaceae bacterium M3_2C_046]
MIYGLVCGQELPIDTTNLPVLYDSANLIIDNQLDTIAIDSLNELSPGDSLADVPPDSIGDIETTIKYSAEDSFYFDYQKKIIKLYGNSEVNYGEIKLEAYQIELDWSTNTVSAEGRIDSTGKLVETPIFTDGPEIYETKRMSYNFNTKKAVISGVVTQQGEAFMHAEKIKKESDDVIYGEGMMYTTCNLPHPHFHIEAQKFKKLPQGSTLVGPFHMRINDVPTPLGFLFGMFPNKREKSSGIIIPTYGEERRRGFFLRDGGYYFSISDYIDLTLLGEIYSKGSVGGSIASVYKKRYAYSGRFNLSYNRQKIENAENPVDQTEQNDLWLTWNHNPESRTNSRLSASVNAGTSTYNTNNPTLDINRNLRQEFNSTVTFNKVFKGTPFSFGTSIRFNQNVATKQATLTFPDISLNMNRIYPLKNLPGKSSAWYKKIYFGQDFRYSRKLKNIVTYENDEGEPVTDTLSFFNDFGTIWRLAESQQSEAQPLKFDIPLSTSFNVLKYFNVSPVINYSQQLFFKKMIYDLDTARGELRAMTEMENGLYTAFTTSFSALVRTQVFGFFNPQIKSIERIRHLITPEISFSYTPDLSKKTFGFYQNYTYQDELAEISEYLPRFRGAPSPGERGALGIAIDNNIEMKVKGKNDTTDQARKIPLIDKFSISTNYNFLADSFQLSNINLRLVTRLFDNKVNLNVSSNIDPYAMVRTNERPNGVRVSEYAWVRGQGFGRITNARFNISTNLNPKAQKRETEVDRSQLNEQEEEELDYIQNNPDLYVDFNIPWNLRINYAFNYTKPGLAESKITQSLDFSGDLSLTDKWKMTFNSGYDFENKEFTMTRINIHRDLHCWEMSFTWVPFGRFQSYSININAVSSLLQDLKLNKQRSWRDR